MKYQLATSLMIFMLVQSQALTQTPSSDEGKRIDEILKGERTQCSNVDLGLTPTLLFETLSPKVIINELSKSLTLQMKIIYYRCIKKSDSSSPVFLITEPNEPYHYTVEQLDGSVNSVQVKKQSHRFSINFKKLKLVEGYPEKIGKTGHVHLIQVSIPLKKLLTPSQEIKLRNGNEILVTIPVTSEVSADYLIDKQTNSHTDFTAGNTFNWNLKIVSVGKKSFKAELLGIK